MKSGKAKILESALSCFSKYGFSGTSMDEIVKQADVSKGLVYYHFKSKEEILIEIIKTRLDEINLVAEAMSIEKDPQKKLKTLLDSLKKELKNRTSLHRLLICTSLQQEVTPLIKELMVKMEPDFEKLFIEEKKMLKELGQKDDEISFLTFRATLQGITQIYLLNPDIFPLDDVIDNVYKTYSLIKK